MPPPISSILSSMLRIDSNKSRNSSKGKNTDALERMYRSLILPRLIEERMLLELRQGRVSKWFSGIGQEAIAVGSTLALDNDEYILPLHRNLGVFTSRGVPLEKLFRQLQGKEGGFSNGRERSFHFGTNEYRIVGMISHLGPQLGIADGIALACKLAKEKKVTLAYTGDGGTSEGDFHEALNVAAVWDLPVIFLIENNGYGLSTPVREQFKCENLSERAFGYGMEGITIDGNDLLKVYETVSRYAAEIRKRPRPVLIECMTFRMRGHEEASGVKYVPKALFEEWEKKDPVMRFEGFLKKQKILSQPQMEEIKKEISAEILRELEAALAANEVSPDSAKEAADIYAPHTLKIKPSPRRTTKKRFVDGVSDGLRASLEKFPNLIVMGQDVAEYGGVFKVTEGFIQEFGRDRIRNTPLCESAIIGAALGLSIKGFKSVVEMQFADFVTCGFNQIVNNLAKIHWRWGQNADVVIRMPTGAGVGAGPFHSQPNEAWFTHVPGLKVFYPSTPEDAKGLLCSAIEDPNPVLFFEHKALYRSVQGEVPDGHYAIEPGKARLVREGDDAVIITYGMGVHWANEIVEKMGASVAVLDLRTLAPLDLEAIEDWVKKTNRALILHEDTLFGGIGGEIAATISERWFEHLDAPVMRVASLDTPVPFSKSLEENFLANSRLDDALTKLLTF